MSYGYDSWISSWISRRCPLLIYLYIMPTGRDTVRYYVTFFNSKDGMGYCFGISTYSSIEDVTHIATFSRQSDFKQVAHTPLSTIFAHIQKVYSTKYIEIYTDSMESLTWANPSHNLSELEIQSLSLFYPVKERCSLFCCPNTNLAAGLHLAREEGSLLLISRALGSTTPTTKDIKNELHSTVLNLWTSEWHQSCAPFFFIPRFSFVSRQKR